MMRYIDSERACSSCPHLRQCPVAPPGIGRGSSAPLSALHIPGFRRTGVEASAARGKAFLQSAPLPATPSAPELRCVEPERFHQEGVAIYRRIDGLPVRSPRPVPRETLDSDEARRVPCLLLLQRSGKLEAVRGDNAVIVVRRHN